MKLFLSRNNKYSLYFSSKLQSMLLSNQNKSQNSLSLVNTNRLFRHISMRFLTTNKNGNSIVKGNKIDLNTGKTNNIENSTIGLEDCNTLVALAKKHSNENVKKLNDSSTTENEINDLSFIQYDTNGLPLKGLTYYESFGVEENVNLKTIKTRFILIARKFHPDKNEKYLDYFSHINAAYDVLKDEQKRAIYDDELLLLRKKAWYIRIFGFNINIIYFFLFSMSIFLSTYFTDFFIVLKNKYFCPLGDHKYSVDSLKSNDENIKLLKMNDITKEDINKLGDSTKVAEDDEYEYFVVKESDIKNIKTTN